jgi:hypothetical protein
MICACEHPPLLPLTICTLRPSVLRERCQEAGIPAWLLGRQQHRHDPLDVLPCCAPPFLLDAVSLPPLLLATLLTQIERRQRYGGNGPQPVIGAILDPADRVRGRLVALAPAMRLLVADTIPWHTLEPWARQLPTLRAFPFGPVAAVGLKSCRRPALPAHILPVLAALPHAASLAEVAEHCGVSEKTVQCVLGQARAALHLPGGRRKHFTRTPALAEALVAGLGRADVPVQRRASRCSHRAGWRDGGGGEVSSGCQGRQPRRPAGRSGCEDQRRGHGAHLWFGLPPLVREPRLQLLLHVDLQQGLPTQW